MSKAQVNTTVTENTDDAVEQLRRANGLEHKSEAARRALETGLSELGYLSDGIGITPARRYIRELSKILVYVAATLFGLSALSTGAYFGAALGVFTGAVSCIAIDRYLLTRVEPAITNRIPRVEVKRRGSS